MKWRSGQQMEVLMKILVGYDGTNAARDALQLALKHAEAFGADVEVVTSMVKGGESQREEIGNAEGGLSYAEELFKEHGIECGTHLLIRGLSPGEDIVKFAEEKKVDEIIMGVRRRSKVSKILMGSTAQYVILKAPCPVVTVK